MPRMSVEPGLSRVRWWWRLGLGVGLGVVVGCSSAVTGAQAPATNSPVASPTSTPASTSVSAGSTTSVSALPRVQPLTSVVLPPRPRSFDLTGVNPCELLPPARRREFGLDRPPQGPDQDKDFRDCVFLSTEGPSVGIFLDTRATAAVKLTQASQDGPPMDRFTVNGFLVTSVKSFDNAGCIAVIDTSDKESLNIQYIGKWEAPRTEICAKLREFVPPILNTLQKMQP